MKIDFDSLVLKRLNQIPLGLIVEVGEMAKKDPVGFSESVKCLIRSGWSEYEFTNEYNAIRRLPLPDYASNYFKKLNHEYTSTKRD